MRQTAIRKLLMKGYALHFEHGPRGGERWFIAGRDVSRRQAAQLKQDMKLVSACDTLLPETPPQSWKVP